MRSRRGAAQAPSPGWRSVPIHQTTTNWARQAAPLLGTLRQSDQLRLAV